MPWQTPTLDQLRAQNRDNVTAQLRSGPMIPNSVERVMSDANAGLAYLTLLYLNWLALQLMPDTAETEWLDRFGNIWLTNADGSHGRKTATTAVGVANFSGILLTPIPNGTQFTFGGVTFQTTQAISIGSGPSPVNIAAILPGATGAVVGSTLSLVSAISGVTAISVASITDGIAAELDDELRVRVLDRIQEPPMGGDATDYEQWALEVPGVTRAWCSPNEMGIGTVTLRFMMDDLRASATPTTNGFPTSVDVQTVAAHIATKRPVSVKDCFVVAPIPEPINFTIQGLSDYNAATTAGIATSVSAMLAGKAKPAYSLNGVRQSAQTIYATWVSDAVLAAPDVQYFDLVMVDHVMPNNGSMAVMGTITYV